MHSDFEEPTKCILVGHVQVAAQLLACDGALHGGAILQLHCYGLVHHLYQKPRTTCKRVP